MAIYDYVIDNSTGANVRADINSVLQAILTNNSNSSSPSTTAAYMFWADTTSGTLKIRNSSDNAWIELFQLDGTLTLEDGSASAPALANRGDLDTGVFFGAANQFNIATGGTERLKIDSTAVVFNETGADVDFRIEGDTNTNLFYVNAGADTVGIGTASPGSLLSLLGANGTVTGISLGALTTISASRYIGICQAGNENNLATNSGFSGIEFGAPASSDEAYLAFHTHDVGVLSSEKFRITKAGQIGIGTTDPKNLVAIHGSDTGVSGISLALGTTSVTHSKYIGMTNQSNGADLTTNSGFAGIEFGGAGSSDEGYIAFHTHNAGVQSAERARFDKNGNLGIAVTDPDQKVEVAGTVAATDLMVGRGSSQFPIIQRHTQASGSQDFTICAGAGLSTNAGSSPTLTDAIGGAAIRIGAGDPTSDPFGGGIRYFANGSTSPNNPGTGNQHVFYRRLSANTFLEAVRITHTGHLKASTEGNYVDITGNYHESFTNVNNQHIHWFQHSGNTQAQQFGIRVRTGDDGNDGNTLLQLSSGSATAGQVTRAGSFSSRNNSYGGTSDIKLKENIVDAKSQWDDIKAIKFRNFNFKDNPSKKMLGVVAQEIELVSAGLVEDVIDRDPDTNEDLGTVTKHVKSSILYMKAMKCLQEAMAKIEVLETKVAALEAA